MSDISQAESGKAWEYGLAHAFADCIKGDRPLIVNSPERRALKSYEKLSRAERDRIDQAALQATKFLHEHDCRFGQARQVSMPSDMEGKRGDVRDILIDTLYGNIGISAKHRHKAIKHSRLSSTIDFGKDWYGVPCSLMYWDSVNPVFRELADLEKKGVLFRDIKNKHLRFYRPVLDAFIKETELHARPAKMMKYLFGRYDFYKIVKENGTLSIQSFNLHGTLKWGKGFLFPERSYESK